MKTCESCPSEIPYRIKIDGKWRSLRTRRFCLTCSPFGTKDRRHPNERQNKTRKCSSCQVTKPLTYKFFGVGHKHGFASNQFSYQCRECHSEKSKEFCRKRKLKCIAYKGGRCQICGYNKSVYSLHFHHLDPSLKEFTVGQGVSWERTQTELDKCQLVCANCHGELHEIAHTQKNTNDTHSQVQ
jgi:hypothetical protein